MFDNIEENVAMLKGSYRKFKGYYYYSNYLLMKERVVEFEKDEEGMEKTFLDLAWALKNPEDEKSIKYLKDIIDSVDFYVLPKKFEYEDNQEKQAVSNVVRIEKKLNSVNFFIDGRIELFILDTLWTIFLSKIIAENELISKDVYGNTIKTYSLFPQKEINFSSLDLFYYYLPKYSKWRNNAFDELNNNYKNKKDSVLISLDIKSYFYSVEFDICALFDYLYPHELLKETETLFRFFEKVFDIYDSRIRKYKKVERENRGYILPIGLFSSMVLGNLYLSDIDKKISKCENLSYYGRYVDDMLFVFDYKDKDKMSVSEILNETLVKGGILKLKGEDYCIIGRDELHIQKKKIKTVYINHKESRAIIDIYNEKIRIVPSQIDFLPQELIKVSDFEEMVVSYDRFSIDNKLREIGNVNIESSKVKKYFSDLLKSYSGTGYDRNSDKKIRKEKLTPIFKFFSGSQAIEYYLNWKDFFAFMVVCNHNLDVQFYNFASKINGLIDNDWVRIEKDNEYENIQEITELLRNTLKKYLNISMYMALALDANFSYDKLANYQNIAEKYRDANMFDNRFVTYPLANFLRYDRKISYSNMELDEIGEYDDNILNMFKFRWSPRFIHFHELLMLSFYDFQQKHEKWKEEGFVYNIYKNINSINTRAFEIKSRETSLVNDYTLQNIDINTFSIDDENKPVIITSVASISMELDKKGRIINYKNEKTKLNRILKAVSKFKKEWEIKNKDRLKCAILVFPECYMPSKWIKDLIIFSLRTQIGVVSGLRHFKDNNGYFHNYLMTLLPFLGSYINYKYVYLNLREKNSYAPIEYQLLKKVKNRNPALYHIFKWQGIKMTSIVCFEITDVVVKAILKGRCALIALAVYNPDTLYFSNIIESVSRDLHSFVIQSNRPEYGDSRVTAPYNSEKKDILKIKGGENEYVVIGTVNYDELMEYEKCYYDNLQNNVCIKSKDENGKRNKILINGQTKLFPEQWDKIKPLPANFKRDDW